MTLGGWKNTICESHRAIIGKHFHRAAVDQYSQADRAADRRKRAEMEERERYDENENRRRNEDDLHDAPDNP